jgi:hypothetical protein
MSRPGFRAPWTHGAYAYAQADTFADFREGMKRKRKQQWVMMPNDGEAGDRPCSLCGVALRDPYVRNEGMSSEFYKADEQSTWIYYPSTKTAVGMHYGCSWGAIFNAIAQIRL